MGIRQMRPLSIRGAWLGGLLVSGVLWSTTTWSADAFVPTPASVEDSQRVKSDGAPLSRTPQFPASIPLVREQGAFESPGGSGLAWVVVVIMVLVFALAGWQRNKKGTNKFSFLSGLSLSARSNEVQVRCSRRLTPRASVHAVEWEGRRLLIGVSESGIGVLGEQKAPTGGMGSGASEPILSETERDRP